MIGPFVSSFRLRHISYHRAIFISHSLLHDSVSVLHRSICLSLPWFLSLCDPVPLFLLGPSPGDSGNWIEIAYGTSSGGVRVIVQHPETVGSGPQLFQTFTVHRSPVTKIMLSEKHLISGGPAGCPGRHLPAGRGGSDQSTEPGV